MTELKVSPGYDDEVEGCFVLSNKDGKISIEHTYKSVITKRLAEKYWGDKVLVCANIPPHAGGAFTVPEAEAEGRTVLVIIEGSILVPKLVQAHFALQ